MSDPADRVAMRRCRRAVSCDFSRHPRGSPIALSKPLGDSRVCAAIPGGLRPLPTVCPRDYASPSDPVGTGCRVPSRARPENARLRLSSPDNIDSTRAALTPSRFANSDLVRPAAIKAMIVSRASPNRISSSYARLNSGSFCISVCRGAHRPFHRHGITVPFSNSTSSQSIATLSAARISLRRSESGLSREADRKPQCLARTKFPSLSGAAPVPPGAVMSIFRSRCLDCGTTSLRAPGRPLLRLCPRLEMPRRSRLEPLPRRRTIALLAWTDLDEHRADLQAPSDQM